MHKHWSKLNMLDWNYVLFTKQDEITECKHDWSREVVSSRMKMSLYIYHSTSTRLFSIHAFDLSLIIYNYRIGKHFLMLILVLSS
jgi:hypothetical protein